MESQAASGGGEGAEVVTKAEFRDWVESGASRNRWTMDEAGFRNRNVMLFYKGGPKGKFIRVDSNGRLTTGSYEDGVSSHLESVLPQAVLQTFSFAGGCVQTGNRSRWGAVLVDFVRRYS